MELEARAWTEDEAPSAPPLDVAVLLKMNEHPAFQDAIRALIQRAPKAEVMHERLRVLRIAAALLGGNPASLATRIADRMRELARSARFMTVDLTHPDAAIIALLLLQNGKKVPYRTTIARWLEMRSPRVVAARAD